jgi:hypothetical protein
VINPQLVASVIAISTEANNFLIFFFIIILR